MSDIKIKKIENGWIIKVHNHIFFIKYSTRKGKKYDVYELYTIGKDIHLPYILSFGASKYQHYFDKLGGYDELNHNDEKRLKKYYARFGHTDNIYSAKWFSNNLLW
jgi:hypothetical protein